MRIAWIGIFLAVLIWSGIGPKDFVTWCLEVAPAVIGGAVLWFTRERFPLTTIVYVLILVPVLISALNSLSLYTITEPATRMLYVAFDTVPLVLGAAIVLLLAAPVFADPGPKKPLRHHGGDAIIAHFHPRIPTAELLLEGYEGPVIGNSTPAPTKATA